MGNYRIGLKSRIRKNLLKRLNCIAHSKVGSKFRGFGVPILENRQITAILCNRLVFPALPDPRKATSLTMEQFWYEKDVFCLLFCRDFGTNSFNRFGE